MNEWIKKYNSDTGVVVCIKVYNMENNCTVLKTVNSV